MAEFLGRLFAGSSDLYTTVEDETLVDGVYMATWTMAGMFNGAPFSAPGMSIVKFVDGTVQSYYSRDYYTEGDVMLGVPELAEAVARRSSPIKSPSKRRSYSLRGAPATKWRKNWASNSDKASSTPCWVARPFTSVRKMLPEFRSTVRAPPSVLDSEIPAS